MTNAGERAGPAWREVAVVLARGAGRRFGAPKALATVGGDERPLVRRVAALYAERAAATGAGAERMAVLVVTTAALRAACESALAGLPDTTVLGAPGGGDTARTLGLAWEWLAARAPGCARVWAHPVDVPRVAARTFVQLARVAAAQPTRIVRPAWDGRPGHPVVVPGAALAALAPAALRSEAPWREVLAVAVAEGRVGPAVVVDVADPGVVLDHDEPDEGTRRQEDGR